MEYNGYHLLLFNLIRRNKDDDLIEELRKNVFDCETRQLAYSLSKRKQKGPVRGVLLTKTFQI